MDNGNIAAGGSVGFALQNSSTQNVWQYFFTGGSNTYTIDAASVSGSGAAELYPRRHAADIFADLPSTYSLTILTYTPGGSAGVGTTTTYTGNLNNPSGGQAITGVRLFNFQRGKRDEQQRLFQ